MSQNISAENKICPDDRGYGTDIACAHTGLTASVGGGCKTEAGTDADRYRAPALDKGLDILELLAGLDEGLSQVEIAKALERSPNEIYRMLDRLVRRGYVLRNAADRYSLTLKLFGLAHQHQPIRRLVAQATPPMRQFARETWQACYLAIHDRGTVLVLTQEDAPGLWSIGLRTGTRLELTGSASGMVLLACVTPEQRQLMLAECGQEPGSATAYAADPEALECRLAAVRDAGHASMNSPEIEAVVKLSVPVFGPDGRVMAALCCPWLERLDQPDAPDRNQIIVMLRETAAAIASGGADLA